MIYLLNTSAEIEYKEQRSIFIGRAEPVESPEEALAIIEETRKRNHDARHHPFAWVIGFGDSSNKRSSDDGEPSKTSGPPILSKIEGEEIANALVVVTRYFGGVKLGTGGLVRAYGHTAGLALEAAGKSLYTPMYRLTVRCSFDRIGAISALVNRVGAQILSTGADCSCGGDGSGAMMVLEADKDGLQQLRGSLDSAGITYSTTES